MPASYPTSAKSFTTKNTGDFVQPADVNDVQTEITAMEQALITGPITLPASTVASLSVIGGSTLADLTVLAPPPSVRVTNSVSLNVPNNATTIITFDTERWQTVAGMHSTVTNPSRLMPPSSGLYTISACVTWGGGSTGVGVCTAAVRIDGSSFVAYTQDKDPGLLIQNVSAQYYFRSTSQYAELAVAQGSGSTKSISVSADYSPDFMMTKNR